MQHTASHGVTTTLSYTLDTIWFLASILAPRSISNSIACTCPFPDATISGEKPCVLQWGCSGVAVCCSALQCVAVCCSVFQCVAVCCRVLQCLLCDTTLSGENSDVLQCVAVPQCVAVCCSVWQCVAVCCNALQCVAVWYSVLQCGAVWCNSVWQCPFPDATISGVKP